MSCSPIKIVSGGQSGVDRGALDAALENGAPCGGWCPRGRRAEDGPIDPLYPLSEMDSSRYVERTRRNVIDSDATLIIYFAELEGGTARTRDFCIQEGKPCLLIDGAQADRDALVARVLAFLREQDIAVLNVAGPRASKAAGAHATTKRIIGDVLRALPNANPVSEGV